MNIFLTGCTGFIGSHVLDQLTSDGHTVTCLIRKPLPLANVYLESNVKFIEKDLTHLLHTDLVDIDCVMHFASVGVSPQNASWSQLQNINVLSTFKLIEITAMLGIKRFICAGTCHEYGLESLNWDYIPSNASLMPITSYAASKASAFMQLFAYSILNSIEFFYGRIFNVYGHGQYSGNFWPSLYSAAMNGTNFEMTSGTQILDFLSVDKVASIFSRAVLRTDVVAGQPFVVNVASGNPLSLLEFATQQWKSLNAVGSLIPGSIKSRPNQLSRVVADISDLHPN